MRRAQSSPTSTACADSPETASDAELLARVRAGDAAAYGVLFDRHHAAAVRISVATVGPALAEEHAAEAFARVLELLRRGLGPQHSFLPYLVTTIRNLHIDHLRKHGPVHLVEDVATWVEPRNHSYDLHDVLAGGEASTAFRSLPDRWRQVLWLRTVEGRSLAEVAEVMQLSPNAAAQLAFRARDGLRAGYLATLAGAAAS